MRTLRDAQDKSLTKLCEESNVSRGYLSNLEHHRSMPSPEIAAAIDRALGANGQLAKLALPVLCRSKSHRCWSSGMSVLIDESAEDVGAEQCAGTEVVYYDRCCWVSEYRYAA
ncbi:MAG: helix-turn-helix transcriptional regulator [Umezawaea sp.]